MSPLVQVVRRRLADAGDPLAAPAMQAYMKSDLPFHGVPSPRLKALCREVFDADVLPDQAAWRTAVLQLWDGATHREERYAALQLAGHRAYRTYQTPQALPLYEHLLRTGAWWDLVDAVASPRVGPVLRSFPDEVADVVRGWATDDDLWVRRGAVLCQLGSRQRTDAGLLRDCLAANLLGSRHGGEFFVRKAVGWALREHAKTDPAWVLAFVDEHAGQLSPLSRREALKHLSRR